MHGRKAEDASEGMSISIFVFQDDAKTYHFDLVNGEGRKVLSEYNIKRRRIPKKGDFVGWWAAISEATGLAIIAAMGLGEDIAGIFGDYHQELACSFGLHYMCKHDRSGSPVKLKRASPSHELAKYNEETGRWEGSWVTLDKILKKDGKR